MLDLLTAVPKICLTIKASNSRYVLTILLWMFISFQSVAKPDKKQEEVTTAFVYQITKYVQWPKSTTHSDQPTLTICVIENGDEEQFDSFKTIENQRSDGRSIVIKSISDPQSLVTNSDPKEQCEVVVINKPKWQELTSEELTELSKSSLLIGSSKEFLQYGGTLSLVMVNNKIKIFINAKALVNSTFKIESRLKALAKVI